MIQQLHRAKDLRQRKIYATDGEIGSPEEFYFDDSTWALRYWVVNTGSWLLGRRVLIAPVALGSVDDEAFHVNLTRKQIQDSPPVDTEAPISRQYEMEYYRYYDWAPYWGVGTAAEPYPPPPRAIAKGLKKDEVATEDIRETHLRSSNEVTGYYIQALDGEIGHVEDLIVDDQEWMVNYFEVDTRNWWPGKKVLVPRILIDDIRWLERQVRMNLKQEVIRAAPEYDHTKIISRDYEIKLFNYYSAYGEKNRHRS